MPLSLLQYNILSLALLLPVMLNLFTWNAPWVSRLFGGIFLILNSFILGQFLAPNRSLTRQAGFGLLTSLILLLISSTSVYALVDLSKPAQIVAWLLFLGFANGFIYFKTAGRQTRLEIHDFQLKKFAVSRSVVALVAVYLSAMMYLFVMLLQAQTSMALRSPWEVVPSSFWGVFIVASAVLWSILWFTDSRELGLPLVGLHLFACFSVAMLVYKLGYGYDSFIHQTAEQLIDSLGIVLPKTPYYLGQYSLVVSLHRLIGLSIPLLDILLVPLLAAVSLPLICSEWLGHDRQGMPGLRYSHWLALAVVLIPFSSFIVTTPQGLANLFFLWIVLAALPMLMHAPVPWSIPELAIIAIAAAMVHPLSGIPALLLVAVLGVEILRARLSPKPWLLSAAEVPLLIIGPLAIPALLWLWSLRTDTQVVFNGQNIVARLNDFLQAGSDTPLHSFMSLLPSQFSYTYANGWWIFLLFIVLLVTTWLLARNKTNILRVYMRVSVFLMINALLIGVFFTFPGIAAYESQAYASRLVTLALWTLLPFGMLGIIWLCRQPLLKRPATTFMVILLLAGANAAAVYASYPRQNRYERSKQFSTSAADFLAVETIDTNIKSDYVVLANQSVSAAAINRFGFRTYYPPTTGGAPLFYYPVPTSSPLYNIYLDMVNDAPTRENAAKAHELTRASTVFFVLNSYWDNAEQLHQRAAAEADESIEIAGGAVTIFTYRFPAIP